MCSFDTCNDPHILSPGEEFESLEWFWGYLAGSQIEVLGRRDLLPYHYMLSTDQPHKFLEPFQFRAMSYVLEYADRNWRNRLADYLVDFAAWASTQIDGPQGLMMGPTKGHQYWHPTHREARLLRDRMPPGHPDYDPRRPAPILWWMGQHGWDPRTPYTSAHSQHVAYAATSTWKWLYGLTSLPGKVAYRLRRRGIDNWRVMIDLEQVWMGSTWASLIMDADGDEERAQEHLWRCLLKASANCDSILWPPHSPREIAHIDQHKPWVWSLQAEMARRCELLDEEIN